MSKRDRPGPATTVDASNATNYPEPFASRMHGRFKARLGDAFGLSSFGVNLTRLTPGAISALFHTHTRQDEFLYVLEGRPTLRAGKHEYALSPGDCMGFPGGEGVAHQLVNRTSDDVVYLEIGDRPADDRAAYPEDDIQAAMSAEGKWRFVHKNGDAY